MTEPDWPTLWRLATEGFALGEHSVHGPAHWRAVERNAIDLAATSGADDATIGTCWDADRLELPRVGIRPDPRYFSTIEGRRRASAGRPLVR